MYSQAGAASNWISLAVVLAVGVIIVLRNSRPRRLRIELLWIRPLIMLALSTFYFFAFPPTSGVEIAGLVVAFVIGAGLGWWRGSLTRIEVDKETQTAMQQASPLGMLLILGLLIVRNGLGAAVRSQVLNLPISVMALSGWLFALAIGLIVTTQLEIWLRARRLVAEAKAA